MKKDKFTIATIQASPVFMDLDASIDKACKLIKKAAKKGADLAMFPEVFLPGYPDWVWHVPPGDMALNQELYALLLEQSVTVGTDETDRLCKAAKDAGIYVVIGINERNTQSSGGSIYNILLFIDPKGKLFCRHQKLVPTLAERMVWGHGDASTVEVHETTIGRIGGLICWENYMPLVRYALYEKGVELYLAPTYDEGETWNASMRHIAKDGRCFISGCCMVLKKEDVLCKIPGLKPYYKDVGEWTNQGNSLMADFNGTVIAGPLNAKEGILLANIDLHQLRASKWNLDVAGHYARPDAFKLNVQSL